MVAAAFAPVSSAISARTLACGAVTWRSAIAAEVMAIATPSAPMPASWSCQRPVGARTPKVSRRFAADFADAHARGLRDDEELRDEEPGLVLHAGGEPGGGDRRDRLESALCVAELRAEPEMEDEVVRARDQRALRAPAHARASREATSDRDLAVAGHERRHKRKERIEVRRQVDVHVR